MGTGLNPQGHEVAKSLLKFRDGVPLGADGFSHMMLACAGYYGEDKGTLEERIAWVRDNDVFITGCANDPETFRWFWGEADKPYLFLQLCRELAEVLQIEAEGGDVMLYESHLGGPQDGSCNGLQHFHAMLRDLHGGRLVNLVDSDSPSDIYMAVASTAMGYVDSILSNSGGYPLVSMEDYTLARQWKAFGILRNDAKKPVMVFPYGGTQQGTEAFFLMRILERIQDHKAKEQVTKFEPFGAPYKTGRLIITNPKRKQGENIKTIPEVAGGNPHAARFINALLWKALRKEVAAAEQVMKWLKSTAWKVAKQGADGTLLSWEVPCTGLMVYQGYVKYKQIPVVTQLCGTLNFREETPKVDPYKHSGSASPNFIHSLDAAHLVLVLNKCAQAGISGFIGVHDSFNVPFGNVTQLHTFIREAFVELHSQGVLRMWLDDLGANEATINKVQPPESFITGDLDLSEILKSTFLFR